jgi:hypothetical protein
MATHSNRRIQGNQPHIHSSIRNSQERTLNSNIKV